MLCERGSEVGFLYILRVRDGCCLCENFRNPFPFQWHHNHSLNYTEPAILNPDPISGDRASKVKVGLSAGLDFKRRKRVLKA